ncbi:MAG: SMC-Scp complex subunit ScpB [Gemmataceae bacterium]
MWLGTLSKRPKVQSLRPPLLVNHRLPLALQPHFIGIPGPAGVPREHEPAKPLAVLEAALLVADEPLSTRRLAGVTGLTNIAQVQRLVQELQELYEKNGSSFQVEELAGGYQLLSGPEYHPWLLRLRQTTNSIRLTSASQETLAIVAYRQPIMRADIEGIRGVQCGEVLRQLMEKGFVRIVRRDESLGRPVLYGTTKKFLQVFGLRSLDELPAAENLKPPPKLKAQRQPSAPDDQP